jgi:hypothetical protein
MRKKNFLVVGATSPFAKQNASESLVETLAFGWRCRRRFIAGPIRLMIAD